MQAEHLPGWVWVMSVYYSRMPPSTSVACTAVCFTGKPVVRTGHRPDNHSKLGYGDNCLCALTLCSVLQHIFITTAEQLLLGLAFSSSLTLSIDTQQYVIHHTRTFLPLLWCFTSGLPPFCCLESLQRRSRHACLCALLSSRRI